MTLSYFTASDGASLAYRDEGSGPPILCLAGLTRNGDDFDFVAPHLSGCRVIRPDYRGRGMSQFTGAASYTIPREAQDAVELLNHLGLARVAVLGTSRGGLIGMVLAATAKDRLSGLCLNDIGPVIERTGLARIADYVGRNPAAPSMAALIERLPANMPGFDNVSTGQWTAFAYQLYADTPDGPRIRYDPDLRVAFKEGVDAPATDLWPVFDACADLPLALIRGANSELLSSETADEMRRRRPDMIFADVPDRAHVPFLDEPTSLAAIHTWLEKLP
jgi:pimeloyl-ACP methyl ester carboxylesterase